MTKNQGYIIIIILAISVIFFSQKDIKKKSLPDSIGDPLELILIKSPEFVTEVFYKTLIDYLTLDIGPAPQKEYLLSITALDSKNFKGIFKRHQNLIFIQKSSEFKISIQHNLFANNQIVFLLECPSYEELNNHRTEIKNIIKKLKSTELNRLITAFKANIDKDLENLITTTHNLSISPPKGFFLAHNDNTVTWIRRETSKISQGVFIANFFKEEDAGLVSSNSILIKIDSLIHPHISSQIEGSYMICDKTAPIKVDTFNLEQSRVIKLQSLWKMENDFMGGVFQAYLYNNFNAKNSILVYTYLYAPGQKKTIPLIQLEALVSTSY